MKIGEQKGQSAQHFGITGAECFGFRRSGEGGGRVLAAGIGLGEQHPGSGIAWILDGESFEAGLGGGEIPGGERRARILIRMRLRGQ